MQQESLIARFKAAGFAEHDQKADFGMIIPGVFYALRIRDGMHQYVSLCSYQGEFCEAVWEIFRAKKNPRPPKNRGLKPDEMEKLGHAAVSRRLLRTEEDLQSVL